MKKAAFIEWLRKRSADSANASRETATRSNPPPDPVRAKFYAGMEDAFEEVLNRVRNP